MPAANRSTRPRPTLLLAAAGVFLLLRVGTGIYEWKWPPKLPSLVTFVGPGAPEAQAPGKGKAILYDFNAEWCAPCQKMKREVFADPSSARLINTSFVAVSVDDDDPSPAAQALRAKHEVTGLPTLVVVPPGGGPVARDTGYEGPEETIKFLTQALRGKQGSVPEAPAAADSGRE